MAAAQDTTCPQGNLPCQDRDLESKGSAGPYFGVEWSQGAPNQLQGMSLNQPQHMADQLHLGRMKQNQMQQKVEPGQSLQGMELNSAQDLNPDHMIMSHPPPLPSPHVPAQAPTRSPQSE